MIDLEFLYGAAGTLVVLLFAYLAYALLRAEEF
ncbi:MAG: K(+)-transporting ATPase subunit F [Xylophilus ampelinus]